MGSLISLFPSICICICYTIYPHVHIVVGLCANHIATRIRYLHIRLTVPHNPSNWQRRCSHSGLLRRFATKPLALAISCALLASQRDLPQVFLGALTPGNGTSGLHAACRKGNLKVVQFFLQSNRHGTEWIISILFQIFEKAHGEVEHGKGTGRGSYQGAVVFVCYGYGQERIERGVSGCHAEMDVCMCFSSL